MTDELKSMLEESQKNGDVELFETLCALTFLQEQINRTLKMAVIFARRLPIHDQNDKNKYVTAFIADADKMDKKSSEMFELLAEAYFKKSADEKVEDMLRQWRKVQNN